MRGATLGTGNLTGDDAVSMQVDEIGGAEHTEGLKAEGTSPIGEEQSSAAAEPTVVPVAKSEGQPSAKRVKTRTVQSEFQGKVDEFDPENPEIPCPYCYTTVSLAFSGAPECGTTSFQESAKSTAEFKKTQGLQHELKFSDRGPRSDHGRLDKR